MPVKINKLMQNKKNQIILKQKICWVSMDPSQSYFAKSFTLNLHKSRWNGIAFKFKFKVESGNLK